MSRPESIRVERDFHDEWAKTITDEDFRYKDFFEAATAPENRYILTRIGSLRGKKILDLGTGPGEASVYFKEKGAEVISFDLSTGMLKQATLQAEKMNLRLTCVSGDACLLPFRGGVFDIVYGANILHHVDYKRSVPEIARVLKPGGQSYFTEPLAYNPAINVYRRMASNFRTPDEIAFRFSDLKVFENYFGRVWYKEFWLLTLWLFVQFFLIERVSPAKERYWKKILKDAKRLEKTYYFLEGIEKKLLRWLPFLRYGCWNVVVIAHK